jgi:hypothetical protein
MGDAEDTHGYFAKFDQIGLTLVRDTLNRGGFSIAAEHQAALRWVSEEDRKRDAREKGIYWIAFCTLVAAVIGIGVGVFGICATLRH